MRNKKGISAIVATVLIILITVAAVTIIWSAIIPMIQKQLNEQEANYQESCCKQSNFYVVKVEALYDEDINDKVIDYYIEEKTLSEFYYDKICRDILEVRLNETLAKNPNFWMDIRSWYYGDSVLFCEYHIYWGERGDFYGNLVEDNDTRINQTDFLLATSNRPPKFNSSLVTLDWDEDMHETKIRNDNPDYNILVNVKINETYARW